jgi:hypothetical protein
MEHVAFYARWKARMESSKSCMEHRSGAPYFLYVAMHVLKVVEVAWSVDRKPLAFYTR